MITRYVARWEKKKEEKATLFIATISYFSQLDSRMGATWIAYVTLTKERKRKPEKRWRQGRTYILSVHSRAYCRYVRYKMFRFVNSEIGPSISNTRSYKTTPKRVAHKSTKLISLAISYETQSRLLLVRISIYIIQSTSEEFFYQMHHLSRQIFIQFLYFNPRQYATFFSLSFRHTILFQFNSTSFIPKYILVWYKGNIF